MTASLDSAPRGTIASGVLIIDKPTSWTSHDVVARARRLLGTRKIGHTGTLDPLGTGILPLCIGRATKIASYAQTADKEYQVTMRLGVSTDTQDSTGTTISTTALPDHGDWDERIHAALDATTGPILQTPPMYAAVKVGGEALYKKARRGETIAREPRPVTIYRISDTQVALPDVSLSVHCSKGTYIRTLVSDVGDSLGVGAHLTALRRISCGPISLADAITLEELERVAEHDRPEMLYCADFLLSDLPVVTVSEYTAERMVQGIAPHISEWPKAAGDAPLETGTLCRVYGRSRGFFALADTTGDLVHPARIRRIVHLGQQTRT